MTLIVAGFDKRRSEYWFGEGPRQELKTRGIFFAADSAITNSDNRLLITGFKKVIELPVRVRQTNFLDTWFQGYHSPQIRTQCALAFAGSTLAAQHIVNSITNHLTDLYPTYVDGAYRLAMPCQQAHHMVQRDYPEEVPGNVQAGYTLDAGFIARVVDHAIQKIVESAQKIGVTERFFEARVELALGVHCPKNRSYHLYTYKVVKGEDGRSRFQMSELAEGEVAVLGIRGPDADEQLVYDRALKAGKPPAPEMLRYVCSEIERRNGLNDFRLALPALLYLLDSQKLERQERVVAPDGYGPKPG